MLVATGRVPLPFTLSRSLVDELRAEAARRDVTVDDLVDQLINERLPQLLAQAVAETASELLAEPFAQLRDAIAPAHAGETTP